MKSKPMREHLKDGWACDLSICRTYTAGGETHRAPPGSFFVTARLRRESAPVRDPIPSDLWAIVVREEELSDEHCSLAIAWAARMEKYRGTIDTITTYDVRTLPVPEGV